MAEFNGFSGGWPVDTPSPAQNHPRSPGTERPVAGLASRSAPGCGAIVWTCPQAQKNGSRSGGLGRERWRRSASMGDNPGYRDADERATVPVMAVAGRSEERRASDMSTAELVQRLEQLLDEGDRWAGGPFAQELAARRAVEGVDALVRMVTAGDDEEWPDDAAVLALKAIGPAVVEPVLQQLQSTPADAQVFKSWCEILADAGAHDERIYDAFGRLYEVAPDFAASCFALYGDARALPRITYALEQTTLTGEIMRDRGVLEYEAAIIELGGSISERGREILARYRANVRQAERAMSRGPRGEGIRRTRGGGFDDPNVADDRRTDKPGRNAPCWCGSGKKYKRCHWAADQQH